MRSGSVLEYQQAPGERGLFIRAVSLFGECAEDGPYWFRVK